MLPPGVAAFGSGLPKVPSEAELSLSEQALAVKAPIFCFFTAGKPDNS
jgi:hypothetical protein